MSERSKRHSTTDRDEEGPAAPLGEVDLELFGEVRRFERRLPHAPEKVWRALTEPAELAAWFPARADRAPDAGASLRFEPREAGEPAIEGEVTRFEPPRLLELAMGAETLRWELSPIPGGTLLVFTTEVKLSSVPANDGAARACRMAA